MKKKWKKKKKNEKKKKKNEGNEKKEPHSDLEDEADFMGSMRKRKRLDEGFLIG